MIFQNKMLANVLGVELLGMACKFKERKENFSPCGHIFHSTQEMYQEVWCMCQDYFCILGVSDMFVYIACEQVLQDTLVAGREKEGELATMPLEFEYLHQKSQCEMLIGGDDISNDVLTLRTCFEMFGYIYAHFCFGPIGRNLAVQLTGSQRGIGGGIQISET